MKLRVTMHIEYVELKCREVWKHLVSSVQGIIMVFYVEGHATTDLDLATDSSKLHDIVTEPQLF